MIKFRQLSQRSAQRGDQRSPIVLAPTSLVVASHTTLPVTPVIAPAVLHTQSSLLGYKASGPGSASLACFPRKAAPAGEIRSNRLPPRYAHWPQSAATGAHNSPVSSRCSVAPTTFRLPVASPHFLTGQCLAHTRRWFPVDSYASSEIVP